MILGCFGGSSESGQTENEDAALLWSTETWEFAALFDGHNGSQSADLTIDLLLANSESITSSLDGKPLKEFNDQLVSFFSNPEIREKYRDVRGETACLVCARRENCLSWFSIGDNLVFVLAPELAGLEQFALNQRQFYEWVGQANTFDLNEPCYSSGYRELRQGANTILMITDGLIEYERSPFKTGRGVYDFFHQENSVLTH